AAISRQREANSTALQPAVNCLFSPLSVETETLPTPPETSNSLNLKEFSVSTAPEVGRIIDR
ncbi:hypothetical protein NTG44_16260, partial [Pseudomonas sp. 20P_3.2_Bac4]|nr:hypothetical protein [Pseudomonas sp. 20P_3.2_Bac4]MCU1746640.1 hypothetical protein [Pseudomonas sp. 20P_3.2_Bac5]